jgi:uncharacterized protein (DUF4415 family)
MSKHSRDVDPASEPDDENPELTQEDFRNGRPAFEVFSPELVAAIKRYQGQRGPQKKPTKESISLRVDRDVVAAYRATGPGWQTRAGEALRLYAKRGLKAHAAADRRRAARTAAAKDSVRTRNGRHR